MDTVSNPVAALSAGTQAETLSLVEAILRQCMAATPADHPDAREIEARLADAEPIVKAQGWRVAP